MLGWIILSVAALSGLLAAYEGNVDRLQAAPGLTMAIAVLSALGLLYIVASKSDPADAPNRRAAAAKAIALMAFVAGAIPAMNAFDLWPRPTIEASAQGAQTDRPARPSAAAVRLRRGAQSRFMAQGEINGAPISFVIDTGAAAVTLKHSDAQAAGVDVSELAFDTAIETANGAAYVAPLRLRSIAVGAIRLDDVEAFVAKPGSLNESLLGMSFLRRLTSYGVSGEFMTLRQ